MIAARAATVPGAFLVDTFPIRACFSQWDSPKDLTIFPRSQIRSRMDPWSWLQKLREEGEEGH